MQSKTHSPSTVSATIPTPPLLPVILAGGSNLDYWPVSRINMPIQFQRSAKRPSPFEQVLAGVGLFKHSLPPIITLPSAALTAAKSQLADFPMFQNARLIVEPVDRGTLHAITICALTAAKIDRSALMVILDTSNPPKDWRVFERLVQQTKESALAREHIISCAQPNAPEQPYFFPVEKGKPTEESGLFHLQPASKKSDAQIFALGSVRFSTPRVLLKSVEKLAPNALSSCSKALQLGEERSLCLWPNLNIWSAQEALDMNQTLIDNKNSTLLRPVDLQGANSSSPNQSNLIFEHANTNCHIKSNGHLVAIAGCENLHIIATRDATLIANTNNLAEMKSVIAKLQACERPEISDFSETYFPWGRQTEVDRKSNYTVLRLEIEPGAQLPAHLHNNRSENWLVLKGSGDAVIDNQNRQLTPGTSLDIPRDTLHACKNTGTEPLVILETRFGAAISNTDIIFFEQYEQLEMA